MILYGIATCDTCKTALKALRAKGHEVEFRDVRADPLSADEIGEIVSAFGDNAINRQSTTWRSLSDWLKASDAEAQLAAQPTLMKRPVIRSGETLFLGWDAKVQQTLLNQPVSE
jgi:Spx/MgsR family transcriptional regulator